MYQRYRPVQKSNKAKWVILSLISLTLLITMGGYLLLSKSSSADAPLKDPQYQKLISETNQLMREADSDRRIFEASRLLPSEKRVLQSSPDLWQAHVKTHKESYTRAVVSAKKVIKAFEAQRDYLQKNYNETEQFVRMENLKNSLHERNADLGSLEVQKQP